MSLDRAIDDACSQVGIVPPKSHAFGRWLQTDTLSGRNGKGDGRLILHDDSVTAWNWQTGEKATVRLGEDVPKADRAAIGRRIEADKRKARDRAVQAAGTAKKLVGKAHLSIHPYLIGKGFVEEKVLTVGASDVKAIAGEYMVPAGALLAALVPVRRNEIVSVQLIWEDGTKKFLAGGEISGGSHRVSTGHEVWLCEGFATGLSLRTALKGLSRVATILCCLSASNIAQVARDSRSRTILAIDHDKPLPQYGGAGTGEYFAKLTKRPYVMPPALGDDFNDLHQRDGIFAVQRILSDFLRETPA